MDGAARSSYNPGGGAQSEMKFLGPAALLSAVFAINLACMPGMFIDGDPSVWREETRSLLSEGKLSVETPEAGSLGEEGQYFILNKADGKWYSKYGVMNALMSAPPMLLQRSLRGSEGGKPDLLLYNLYNVFLSLLVGAMLYRITGFYAAKPAVRVLFVFAALYSTFLWYYQRAQSSELYQVLFFLCFYELLVRFLNGLEKAQGAPSGRVVWAGLGVWLMVLALVLTRVLFGLLIFTVAASFSVVLAGWDAERRRRALKHYGWLMAIGPVLILGLLGAINRAKFGSPWLSGYHIWRPEQHLPTGPLLDGLGGLLFSRQYSIFLNFPLLIFALFSARPFFRKHRLDMTAVGLTLVTFLLGEWTYGPRYLIFILPVLSFPFLGFLEGLFDRPGRRRIFMAAGAAAVLLYSAYLQIQVNRLDFFAYYRAREPVRLLMNEPMRAYFYGRPLGLICADLIANRERIDALPFFQEMKRLAPPYILEDYAAKLTGLVDRGNSYWSK